MLILQVICLLVGLALSAHARLSAKAGRPAGSHHLIQQLRSAQSLATILHALLCGSYLACDSTNALLHALAGCILAIAPVVRSTSAAAIWVLLIAQDAVLLELSFTYISGVICLLIAAEGWGLFCSLPEGALRRHNIAKTSRAGKETLAEKGAFYDASKSLPCKAYATHSIEKWNEFSVIDFEPKPLEDFDVEIAIKFCGVCASDVHTLTGGWNKDIILPMITGHEIAGLVHRTGAKCTEFKAGDRVGVGAQAYSCLSCDRCLGDNEQYCRKAVETYNATYPSGAIAHGGYSTIIRVHERFVFPIPDRIALEHAASFMCAGLTVWSPLTRYGCGQGKRVAVVGMGGLGHYAVLFAAALGADEVIVISHTDSKKEDAFKMGATSFVATGKLNGGLSESGLKDLDIVLTTVDLAEAVPLADLLALTKVGGVVLNVGLPDEPVAVKLSAFAANCTNFTTSNIGSKKEAVAMLELAAKKDIRPWIQLYDMKDCGLAVSQLHGDVKSDVRYRQVLRQDLI